MNRTFHKSTTSLLVAALTAGALVTAAPMALAASTASAQVSVLEAGVSLAGATDPRWVSATKVVVSVFTEETATDYLVDVQSKKAEPIVEGVSGLTISPNGALAAYAADSGKVYTIDLATKKQELVVDNDAEKFELQFSADSKKLYYIEGSKLIVINELDLESKKVTKLVDDKVENKVDLRVSADGKKLLYSVEKVGKTTVDSKAAIDADALSIDVSGATTQLNIVNLASEKPAAYALTSKNDNKSSAAFLDAEHAIYVSSDPEAANARSIINKVNVKNGGSITFFNQVDVVKAEVVGDKVYVLGSKLNQGLSVVYVVNAATESRSTLLLTEETVLGMTVSANGTVLVTTMQDDAEAISVVKDGKLEALVN